MGYQQRKLCGVYLRKTKTGESYMSGKIAPESIVTDRNGNHFLPVDSKDLWINIFKNKRKSSDKHPDYELNLSWSGDENKENNGGDKK